jgi:hypothetical protein
MSPLDEKDIWMKKTGLLNVELLLLEQFPGVYCGWDEKRDGWFARLFL